MSIIGWWLASGSVANFLASMIIAIVSMWHPNYEQQIWHVYLVYVGLIWLSVGVIIFGAAYLPYYNKAIFALSVATFAATTISLFVVARDHHAPASFILTDTNSVTGWSSYGLAFLLAVVNATFGFLGTDCAAHLAEEIPNPSRNLPRCMIYPVLMGLGTALPFTGALLYSITDLSAILSTTRLPLIDIYAAATGSDAAASVLLAFFAFCFFGCLVGVGKLVPSYGRSPSHGENRNDGLPHNLGRFSRWRAALLLSLGQCQSQVHNACQCQYSNWCMRDCKLISF